MNPHRPAGLLLVTTDIEQPYEDEFNRWYNDEHVPERMRCPGFLKARRFVAVEGGPKYLALYDLESVDAVLSPSYRRALENPTPWTQRLMGRYTEGIPGEIPLQMRRAVYTEIPIGHQ